jgi:hypothetical protein
VAVVRACRNRDHTADRFQPAVAAGLDREDRSERPKSVADSSFAVVVVFAGDRVVATQESPANASGNGVKKSNVTSRYDPAECVGGHGTFSRQTPVCVASRIGTKNQ